MHSCLFLALSVSLNKKLTSAVLAQMSPEPLAEKTELMMCLRQTVSQYIFLAVLQQQTSVHRETFGCFSRWQGQQMGKSYLPRYMLHWPEIL